MPKPWRVPKDWVTGRIITGAQWRNLCEADRDLIAGRTVSAADFFKELAAEEQEEKD